MTMTKEQRLGIDEQAMDLVRNADHHTNTRHYLAKTAQYHVRTLRQRLMIRPDGSTWWDVR